MKRIGIVEGSKGLPNRNYHYALQGSGAEAITLKPGTFLQLLPQLDGVLFPGGGDLNPSLYGEENIASEEVDNDLDRYEMEVMNAVLSHQLPVLGICRGHQMLNVYFGGSLWQDIDRTIHSRNNGVDRIHGSRVEQSSYLYDIFGSERISVNSSHHQAIRQLAPELEAIQYSDDGLIEGMRHKTLPVFSVQWHPERTCLAFARPDTVNGLALFHYFLEQC